MQVSLGWKIVFEYKQCIKKNKKKNNCRQSKIHAELPSNKFMANQKKMWTEWVDAMQKHLRNFDKYLFV